LKCLIVLKENDQQDQEIVAAVVVAVIVIVFLVLEDVLVADKKVIGLENVLENLRVEVVTPIAEAIEATVIGMVAVIDITLIDQESLVVVVVVAVDVVIEVQDVILQIMIVALHLMDVVLHLEVVLVVVIVAIELTVTLIEIDTHHAKQQMTVTLLNVIDHQ